MPLYNTATVATALGTSPKWLDNLLSHNKIDGVSGGKQGVPRRLSADAVRIVALVRELTQYAGLPIPSAVSVASSLLAIDSEGSLRSGRQHVELSPALSLELDLSALDREISAGLAHAVEVTPHPVRGRPRQKRR